jgi:hypothetical protein
MASSSVKILFLIVAVSAMATNVAGAQERAAGQHLIYDVTTGGQSGHMGSGRSDTTMLDLALDQLNPDGSAHANASMEIHGQKMSFEASISSTGAITGKSDPNIKPHYGMSEQESNALAANSLAQNLGYVLAPLNAFADACAARGALHVGDSWQGTMKTPVPADVVFTVTGRQSQAGRDSFAIKIASAGDGPATASGQGYYDPVAHLVTGLHIQLAAPSGEMTTDVTLHA